MSEIPEARALFAKWRTAATEGEWSIEADTAESSWLGRAMTNPEVLDAIDGMLAQAEGASEQYMYYAEHIASALVQQGKAMGL